MLFNLWAHLSYFLKDFSHYLILDTLSFILLIFGSYKVYKSQVSEKRKKIFITAIFTIFIIIFVFSAFEAYFRYRYDDSDGLGFLKVNEKWHKRHIVFNNYFFRDRDFDGNKKEGTARIGVIGDSIAEGDGIKDVNNRFSNILEKKLKDTGKNVEVYNLGRAGYDTWNEIDAYNSVKHLNFDIIVWEYFINDIQPKDSTGTPIIAKNSQRAKILEFISNQSFFLDFLYWRFSSVYDKTILALRDADINQYKNEKVLSGHKKQISDFIKSLKDDNKKVVVVMFPSIQLLGSGNYPTFINDIMEAHFKENGVEVLDLYDYLKDKNPKDLIASKFDTHPNEIVHKLAAEKLYEKVAPLLK